MSSSMPSGPARARKLTTIVPARNAGLPDRDEDRASATMFRNLLLYGLLFHLFAFQASGLFPDVSGSSAPVLSDAGNLFNQLVLPAALLAACLLVRQYRVPVRVLLAAIIPIAPLLLVIALSTAWSEFPELTIRRASHELVEASTLALLATCFSDPREVLAIFFRAFVIIGCLDLFSAAIFPETLTARGFAGIHSDKNIAGQFFFVALPVYLLGALYEPTSGKRLLGIFSLVSGVAMLVLTQSKTSVGASLAAFSSVLLTRGLFSRNPAVRVPLAFFCFLGVVGAIVAITNWDNEDLLEMLVGDPTLTGRDQIWAYAVSKFDASPVVGAGYGAIWQIGPTIQVALRELGVMLVFNEAHNGYLDIAAQLGIIGILGLSIFLIITLFNVLFCWITIEKSTFYGTGALTIYIFFGLLLSNITESLYFQTGIGSSSALIFLGAFAAGRKAVFTANPPADSPRPYAA